MPFFTRPNFEDRQHVQYSGTSITLSGFTNINNTGYLKVKSQTLDFTGTTTASTTYNIAGVNGYINQGELSSLIVEPPIILLSGITGTTTVDVTGYYLGSLNSGGSVTWIQPPTSTPTNFTGNTSADCITNIFLTNLNSCSPLHIQNISDGDVLIGENGNINVGIGTFSASSKLHVSGNTLIDGEINIRNNEINNFTVKSNGNVGINTSNPSYLLHVVSGTNELYYEQSLGGRLIILGSDMPRFDVAKIGVGGGSFGIRASSNPSTVGYGNYGDTYLYAGVTSNGLNLINAPSGGGTADYIRFYAGVEADEPSHVHIQGKGVTQGYVGLGTESPTQKLHVSGNTRLENNNNGDVYLLAANTNNGGNLVRGVIGSSSIADISGRVLSGLFATSGYNTDLSGSNFGDGGTGYLKNALTISVAGNNPRGDINIGTRNPNKFLRFFSGTDDFDSGSLRGSLNSNGYWGFGTNLTGQTATVQIGDTTNPGSFKYIHTGGTISPGYVLTTTDSSGNAIWQELPQNSIIDPYYQVTGGTFTWDVSGNSSNYEVLLTSNSTINLINVQNGQYGTLISTQDGVGSRSIAFGTVNGSAITHKVANGGGGLPTLTATANSIDILTFTFNGTVMYWSVGNSYT